MLLDTEKIGITFFKIYILELLIIALLFFLLLVI
jgi:hypothetical protein